MMILGGQSNALWHYAAGRWPGSVGLLLGPSYFRKTPLRPWFPYALDNDRFMAHSKKEAWNEGLWLAFLQWSKLQSIAPLWALVPDVWGSKERTLNDWQVYFPIVKEFGFKAAFAAQDGMTPQDVPDGADVVFIGGSDQWRWRHAEDFCRRFKRVHIGRINQVRRLTVCERIGVESVDGTGWFRNPNDPTKLPALLRWLEGHREHHPSLGGLGLD